MTTVAISRKIERFARVNGISYVSAASILGKRGANAKRRKACRKSAEEINQERFEKMKAQHSYLYE